MIRSAKTYPVVLGVLLGAVVVGAALWFTLPRSTAVYTDADTIRASKELATLRDILWQPPELLGDGLNSDADEYEPSLSPDGLTLLFVRGRPGDGADIYQSIRTPEGWTAPVPVAALNTEYDDLGPAFTPDGEGLYFYSDRPGSIGGYDIWFTERTSEGWGEPRALGPSVNSPFNDYGPSVSPDSSRFYFASNRPRNPDETLLDSSGRWPATVRESFQSLPYDIYCAEINDRGIGEAALVHELSSSFNDGAPEVSPVNDFMYFASDRPGGEGGFDLYRVRLVNGEFFPIEHLGDGVNTEHNELDPTLGMGGFGLAFSSDRLDRERESRDYDLYRTESREVFRDVELLAARMTFLDFLKIVVPWLLLLLALLGLLALLRKIRTDDRWKARWRRLGLMAKCLIVSGLLHMLILALLTVWQVSNNLEGLFNKPGGSKVTLVSSSVGGGAISQIRGEVASSLESDSLELAVEQAAMEFVEAPRFETALQSELAPTQVQDQMQAASVQLTRAEPTRDLPTTDSQPAPAEAEAVSVSLPSASQREAVAETEVSTRSAQLANQSMPTQAEVQLASGANFEAQMMQLEDVSYESVSVAVENPVSAPTRSEPAERQLQELSVPEIENVVAESGDMAPPLQVESARQADEAELSAKPLSSELMSDEAPAVIAVGGESLNHQMAEVELWVHDGDVENALETASSDAPRQIENLPALDLALLDSEIDYELPESVTASQKQAAEVGVEVDELAEAFEDIGDAGLALAGAEREIESESQLDDERIDESAFDDVLESGATYQRSTPAARAELQFYDLGAFDLDLALPAAVEAPEQIAIERYFTGIVVDEDTDLPIAGVLVRIDSDHGDLVETRTGDDGTFALRPEFDSDYVAVTASADGYAPSALNLPIDQLDEGVFREIRLEPIRQAVISIEEDPVVHHLGNNAFGGRINSQFQKESEGTEFVAGFEVTAVQHAMLGELAGVTLLAKGLQTNNRIEINGRRLSQRLNNSPSDGSFGRFLATFPAEWLEEGENTIRIESRISSGDDYDDFEIVNVQILLAPPEQPGRASGRRLRNTL